MLFRSGIEADLEVIELMVQALGRAGASQVRIDLCHMGIVPALVSTFAEEVSALGIETESLYALLLAKDLLGLKLLFADHRGPFARACLALPTLYGPVEAKSGGDLLDRARRELPDVGAVRQALDTLEKLCTSPAWARFPGVSLSVDLADLRGYRYHNGVSFAAYVAGRADAVGRGGRYDGVGRAFGRSRAATGFSLELRELASMLSAADPDSAIRAPWSDDPAMAACVAALRAEGQVVIQALPGHDDEQQEFSCDRELVLRQGRWEISPLSRAS